MTLLLVEDDQTFAAGVIRMLTRRGFACTHENACARALATAATVRPTHVLLDLNLGDETTQPIIPALRALLPNAVIVVLTGYGTIPSTVQAMKDGANHYLCKPATPEQIVAALQEAPADASTPEGLWEMENARILEVLRAAGGNVSHAAKTLGLHRRTLQRRLRKLDGVV